jgi:hypothetical protein
LAEVGEKFMSLETLAKDLCFYANMVTPPNWNIFTNTTDHRCLHRTLNIHLLLIDITPLDWVRRQRETGLIMPSALTRAQTYKKVSEAIRCKAEMQEECRSNVFAALIHELAHVAVSRLLARKYRPFKSGHIQTVNSAVMLEEEMHGPTYRKALRRFALRVEAAWGQETAKKIWQELESI